MLVPVVNNAPRITLVSVKTFEFPMLGVAAHRFKPTDLSALVVGPIRSGQWSQPCHKAETSIGIGGSEERRMLISAVAA